MSTTNIPTPSETDHAFTGKLRWNRLGQLEQEQTYILRKWHEFGHWEAFAMERWVVVPTQEALTPPTAV